MSNFVFVDLDGWTDSTDYFFGDLRPADANLPKKIIPVNHRLLGPA